GRGVAPRALGALADWAFTAFAHEGLTRLELLHQVDNTASCRVAEKAGFTQAGILPAAPPAFPLEGTRTYGTRPRPPDRNRGGPAPSSSRGPAAGPGGVALRADCAATEEDGAAYREDRVNTP
ncbi:GNAT family N-acetyltransferase, partial [Streptomyces prasinus]|uniref:GNAT family N-acetyltransferase n=1 Tax=Streptomyces prasinus TaxID=67345 RepID=UPI00362D3FDD